MVAEGINMFLILILVLATGLQAYDKKKKKARKLIKTNKKHGFATFDFKTNKI
jgi:hypothetical protein